MDESVNPEEILRGFLRPQFEPLQIEFFLLNLALGVVLATILARFYVRYGQALSNRRAFAGNFLMITTTTLLVISIVKSSLALSLGLVGALSIVRFRTAIKEPEELAFVFLGIGVGLGLGANQTILTCTAFTVILLAYYLRGRLRGNLSQQDMLLSIVSKTPHKIALSDVVAAVEPSCRAVTLRRLDETESTLEVSFAVELRDFAALESCKERLQQLNPAARITYLG